MWHRSGSKGYRRVSARRMGARPLCALPRMTVAEDARTKGHLRRHLSISVGAGAAEAAACSTIFNASAASTGDWGREEGGVVDTMLDGWAASVVQAPASGKCAEESGALRRCRRRRRLRLRRHGHPVCFIPFPTNLPSTLSFFPPKVSRDGPASASATYTRDRSAWCAGTKSVVTPTWCFMPGSLRRRRPSSTVLATRPCSPRGVASTVSP